MEVGQRGQVDLAELAADLDATYRRIERIAKQDCPVLTPLDRLEELASLVARRDAVAARLPHAGLPEVLLEIWALTGFAAAFTHIGEGNAQATTRPDRRRAWHLEGWRGADAGGSRGCIDIDIRATPFTNTLPSRRRGLQAGVSATIRVVFMLTPGLIARAAEQRYTALGPDRWRFEALGSDFTAELTTYADGLVVEYPGLFRRVEGVDRTEHIRVEMAALETGQGHPSHIPSLGSDQVHTRQARWLEGCA